MARKSYEYVKGLKTGHFYYLAKAPYEYLFLCYRSKITGKEPRAYVLAHAGNSGININQPKGPNDNGYSIGKVGSHGPKGLTIKDVKKKDLALYFYLESKSTIFKEVLEGSYTNPMNKKQLSKKYTKILEAGKPLLELEDISELRAVLAYELWADGMEWPDVQQIITGNNYKTREELIEALKLMRG